MNAALSTPATYQEANRLDRARKTTETSLLSPLAIMLAGNANLDFLAPALRVQLAIEGFDAKVSSASFGNWISDVLEHRPETQADVWVIWLTGMGATRGMTARPDVDVATIALAVEQLLQRGCKVILIQPEPTTVEDEPFSPFAEWRHRLINDLTTELPAATVQFNVDHLVRRRGMAAWAATRYWEQSKAPCHPDAATAVGVETAVVISRVFRPAVRAVAVDLDGTLWGGIVGEVGAQGLDLDPDGTGRPFLELQRFLLDLSERGIPLAVISKNDDEQARLPFLERPEMLLCLDTFVRFDASWEPKFEAISRFAEQLNVGIDSICFLDDSAKERDEARRLLPGLIVPELAEMPAQRVTQLLQSRLFTAPVVSAEDRLRVAYFKRSQAPAAADLESYLGGLEMQLDVVAIGTENAERALALLHKTNQFNLTLWRPAPSEIDSFVTDETSYAYTFRLRDRVGDAGIVSVLLASVQDDTAYVRAWVLSCRVFSRGVEWAAADHLAQWLDKRGVRKVVAPYKPGPRNAMMSEVLLRLGLTPAASDGGVTPFSAERLLLPAHHIRIDER